MPHFKMFSTEIFRRFRKNGQKSAAKPHPTS